MRSAELNKEDWIIRLRDTETGGEVEYHEVGRRDVIVFLYEDGNYGCDCNRSLFFNRANGMSEEDAWTGISDCTSENRFIVVCILNTAGEQIYSELDMDL